jgi:hypothetical protein
MLQAKQINVPLSEASFFIRPCWLHLLCSGRIAIKVSKSIKPPYQTPSSGRVGKRIISDVLITWITQVKSALLF